MERIWLTPMTMNFSFTSLGMSPLSPRTKMAQKNTFSKKRRAIPRKLLPGRGKKKVVNSPSTSEGNKEIRIYSNSTKNEYSFCPMLNKQRLTRGKEIKDDPGRAEEEGRHQGAMQAGDGRYRFLKTGRRLAFKTFTTT